MSLRSTCIDRLARSLLLLAFALGAGGACAQSVEKVLSPGEVIEGHVKYEHQCEQCHQRFDKGAMTKLCLDCHKDIAKDVAGKTHLHGKLEEKACRTCHTDHKGRKAKIAAIDKAKFDHAKTNFRLNGAHAEIHEKCESCHKPSVKYRDAPKLCNDCHAKIDQEKGHKGKLGSKCENCHNEKKWTETRFDHEKTKFSLLGGKHADVKCKDCHADKTYQNTPLTCNGCHKKDDQEKGHKGRYGIKCESCHNDKGWKEITFNHDDDTHYALKGKHRQTKCNACHTVEKGQLYQQQKLPTRCVACHKNDDQEKGHKGGLGEKCETCHNERGWKNSTFDHDDTKFPLRDKHKDAKCDTCHTGGVSGPKAKLKLEMTCIACHKKNDEEKGHKGRYGNKCETCHTAKEWKKSIFDHDKDTKYLLKGKHHETKCDACHLPALGQIYGSKIEKTCFACHKKDDKHKGQLGKVCEDCHNEKDWKGAPFDHNKARFPLDGAHVKVECYDCHKEPKSGTPKLSKLCISCHVKDDVHNGAFSAQCERCHVTTNWKKVRR